MSSIRRPAFFSFFSDGEKVHLAYDYLILSSMIKVILELSSGDRIARGKLSDNVTPVQDFRVSVFSFQFFFPLKSLDLSKFFFIFLSILSFGS